MLKKHFIILFVLSVPFSSCSNNKSPVKENKASTNAGINIDNFSEFPPEIEGCSCLFSSNENDFESGKFFYADDYQGTAYISINGEKKQFTLRNSHKVSDGHHIRTWTSSEFEATLEYKQVGQVEEIWQQKGTMRIKTRDREDLIKEFYGECGC